MFNKTSKLLEIWREPLTIAVSIVSLLLLLRYLGAWQFLELKAFDALFRLRPPESPEKQIVIVALQETEIEQYGWPVSDRVLAQLINKISDQHPTVIGLDIFRDVRVAPGYEELVAAFQSSPNLIGIQKVTGSQFEQIAPPPILEETGQTSASDLIVDPDGVVRRYLLFPAVPPERNLPSLGIAVASSYLRSTGKSLSFQDGLLHIGQQSFPRVTPWQGGYAGIDDGGYQMLLNYRSASFLYVSFADVLEERINPNFFENKIVFIGSAAPSTQDLHLTPYSWRVHQSPQWMWGVEIHAQATSQILSAVLGDRPLITSQIELWEQLWIFGWSAMAAAVVWHYRATHRYRQLFFMTAVEAFLLSSILCLAVYIGFEKGLWLPFVPGLLGIWATALGVTGYIYVIRLVQSKTDLASINAQLQENNATLEARVAEQTQRLRHKNEQLTQALTELENLRERQIEVQNSASVENLVNRLAHEIKNPVSIVFNQAQLTLDDLQLLNSNLANNKLFFNDLEDIFIELEQLADRIKDKLFIIDAQGRRTTQLISQILRFSRQEYLIKDFCFTDVNQLVHKSCNLVCQERQKKHQSIEVNLKIECDYSLEKIEVVAEHIQGALINILNNAWDTLETKYKVTPDFIPTICIQTLDLERWIAFTIQDNGEGISPKNMTEIFKIFFSTKKLTGQGNGLGLFFVKQIIENEHRGRIKVETKFGCYTKFTILLPKKLNLLPEKIDREQPIFLERQDRGSNRSEKMLETKQP
ncbi:MAG: CHASE2 domain-containing protein [Cyanophyceae cyanobacterium]